MPFMTYDELIKYLKDNKYKHLPNNAVVGDEFEEWLRKDSESYDNDDLETEDKST